MKKRIWLLCLALAAGLVLGGCAMQTVEEMYCLPKRSEAYSNLQSAIDMAMVGLEYSAPLYGDNRQTVQVADLDGDGVEEYLVFAKGGQTEPLQLLIFRQQEDGTYGILEVISGSGTAFQQVEYVQLNDRPGYEIVLGRQLSNQVMGNVSVYTFADGKARQLLTTSYSKFLTCQLRGGSQSELMLLKSGEADMERGVAVIYSCKNGVLERSVEAELSVPVEHIKRITASALHGGQRAVYVSGSADNSTIVTDVFTIQDGRFINLPMEKRVNTGVDTLRNYYVYAEDVDGDGVLELPELIAMKPLSYQHAEDQQYLLRWYDLDADGQRGNKLCTFHNYTDGWYLRLDNSWASLLTLERQDNRYTFYLWNSEYNKVTMLFSIFRLDDEQLQEQSQQGNQFILHQSDTVTYAAKLEYGSAMYGFTEEFLMDSFRLIQPDALGQEG